MAKALRLDSELVRRGLAASRSEAREAIERGLVKVGGMPAARVSTMVAPGAAIVIESAPRRFVSRGGDKLDGALQRLDVPIAGLRWLDAGASTGGFTDRLLKGGAAAVIAVDVGYGQLDWSLRNDERVTVLERVNVRTLTRDMLPFTPDGVVADLSFISLTLALPSLVAVASEGASHLLMVKPQFEVGRDSVGRSGVVREPELWHRAVLRVVDAAAEHGLGLVGATASHPPGPAGNREFFIHLRRGVVTDPSKVARAVAEATP